MKNNTANKQDLSRHTALYVPHKSSQQTNPNNTTKKTVHDLSEELKRVQKNGLNESHDYTIIKLLPFHSWIEENNETSKL